MKWSIALPKKEGWYFWSKRRQPDQFYWFAFFVDDLGNVWTDGAAVPPPDAGYWIGPIDIQVDS